MASLGIEPSTTSTKGSSSPRSALCHHSMKLSAPCSGPHSKSISGQCTATLGSPGRAPSTISSILGWVAAVSATESPSQPSPPFIQRMWTTGSAVGVSLVCSAVAIARPPPRCGVGGTVDALGPGDDVPGDAAPEDAALGDAAGDGVPEYAVPEYAVPGRGRAGQLPGGRLLGDRLPGARRPGGGVSAGCQHLPAAWRATLTAWRPEPWGARQRLGKSSWQGPACVMHRRRHVKPGPPWVARRNRQVTGQKCPVEATGLGS